jgi:hypothetical protein
MNTRFIGLVLCLPLLAALLVHPNLGLACSLCEGRFDQTTPTMRQEAAGAFARAIVSGTLQKSTPGVDGKGSSTFAIDEVLRDHEALRGKKTIEVGRYLPEGDPKNPPRYIIFCDVKKGILDPYRGIPLLEASSIDYFKKALALPAGDSVANLVFFFDYLDSKDREVKRDAFLEFARTNDRDILKVGPKLDGARLRNWITSPMTPPNQASLFATLLGAGGRDGDATFLRKELDRKTSRSADIADGLLAGYLQLRPREGWELLDEILRDRDRPLTMRLAAVRTVRFLYNSNPRDNRDNVLKTLQTILDQDDLADLGVENLRMWEMWDLTPRVLALYGKKGYDAPLMEQALLRYALSCKPTEESKALLARVRAADPQSVKDAEEALKYEKGG